MAVYSITREEAQKRLDKLVELPLEYAGKWLNTELYFFEFGNVPIEDASKPPQKSFIFALHVLCRFRVIWRNGRKATDTYHEDTPKEQFEFEAKRLTGKVLKHIALSDKNDLWLDFGDFWMVFAAYETGEESWRILSSDKKEPHLVASDAWLKLVY